MNDHIASMLETIIDTSVKTNKKDEKITELPSKLSNYVDHTDRIRNKEGRRQTLVLQVKQDQDEKSTELS